MGDETLTIQLRCLKRFSSRWYHHGWLNVYFFCLVFVFAWDLSSVCYFKKIKSINKRWRDILSLFLWVPIDFVISQCGF